MGILRILFFTSTFILGCSQRGECQSVSRINGQLPSKWITVKHTISPRRDLQHNMQSYDADFEDIYAKVWVPLLLTKPLKIAAGAFYRTEQIEMTGISSSELNNVDHWNLRSAGVDFKSIVQLSSQYSFVLGTNLSHSATVQRLPLTSSPLNYAVSGTFMQRKSDNLEFGFGVLHNNTLSQLPFLPILVWNQTFNAQNGIEMCLPYKVAWRRNLSERSILHFKAEGVSRNYFIDQHNGYRCSRLDVDIGVAYTRLLNKWIGFEFFGGFRQNISAELPNDVALRNSAGFAFSSELFIIPAFKSKKDQ